MKKIISIISVAILLFASNSFASIQGAALNFDGVNDFVGLGNVLNPSYTKEAWIKITNMSLANNIVSGGITDGQHCLYAPFGNGNRLSAGHNSTLNYVSDPTPLVVNTWYHVAVTYDAATTTMKLYKNGVLISSNSAVPAYTGGNAVRIGAYGAVSYLFGGNIDEVRIWNYARTATEIMTNMNCELNGSESGLRQYYKFNQGTASGVNTGINTLTDIAGVAQNGTLSNFALTGSTSNWVAPGGVVSGFSCCPTAAASISSQTNVSCNGGSNGSATVSASGGTTFTYSWAPSGGTAATASGLTAGTYTCTVTNECSSVATATVTITETSPISASISSQNDVSCNGGTNGDATVLASGGAGSFTYSWAPSGGTAATASGLGAGTYTCTVTDANSCSNTATVTITEPAVLNVSASSPSSICFGNSGNISASSTGGTGAVTYVWNPGSLSGATVSVSPSVTTSYTVTGTDANGCSNTATTTVTVNSLPTISVVSSPSNGIICNGSPATLTASGASSYSWTGGVTNGVGFFPSATNTYTVTGTAANGCQNTNTATITVNNCSSSPSTVPCGNTYNKKSQTVSATNVVGAVSYRFSFYDNVTNALITQYSQASRTLTLANVPGIYYNKTYKWTVAVDMGSGFGAESNLNCTITLGIPSTTVPCGVSFNAINTYSNCPNPGGISMFRFSFYNNITNALVAQVTQASNYIYFNTVPGLYCGNTYKWTVECKYATSASTSAFGPASSNSCTVTFNPMATTVPCGGTYNRSNGYAVAPAVTGAINYRFTFWTGSTQIAQRTQTSNYLYFANVVGINGSSSYTWTVEVQYYNGVSNVYGPPSSSSCTITFNPAAISENPDQSNDQSVQRTIDPATNEMNADVQLVVYPNPTSDLLNIDVNDPVEEVTLFSITGEVIMNYGPVSQVSLADLPVGTYFLVVKTTLTIKRTAVIKE